MAGKVPAGPMGKQVSGNEHFANVLRALAAAEVQREQTLIDLETKVRKPSFNPLDSLGKVRVNECAVHYTYRCTVCSGAGSQTCRGCQGSGQERCYTCQASGFVNCHACSGRGSRTVYEQRPHGNGYVSVPVQKSCYSCIGGRYSCPRCSGRGQNTCQTCSGAGHNTCAPCSGSGALTDIGQVIVNAAEAYYYECVPDLPTAYKPVTRKLADLMYARTLGRLKIVSIEQKTGGLNCSYSMPMLASHQRLQVGNVSTQWLFYANPPRVLDAGHMVSKLLESDCKALANGQKQDLTVFLQSEVNAQILTLHKPTVSPEDVAAAMGSRVSAQYVKEATDSIFSIAQKELGYQASWTLFCLVLASLPVRSGLGYAFSLSTLSSPNWLGVAIHATTLWAVSSLVLGAAQDVWLDNFKSKALKDWVEANGLKVGGEHYTAMALFSGLVAAATAWIRPI